MLTMKRFRLVQVIPPPARCGATCPACGSTDTHVVRVESGGVVVRTYFECGNCGNVW